MAENLGFFGEPSPNSSPTSIFLDQSLLIDRRDLSISSIISEGPHSIVYEGWHKTKPVAVKVLQPSLSSTPTEHKEKFIREVMMLSRVKHDNLVKFIGASIEPSMLIVTELMEGGSLKKYLWDMRPCCPDLKMAIGFALDIAHVMECLHANGIIHRDLKPGNLLLTGDQKKLKLADFGLAREETVEEMMSSEVGTYRWMAPELYSTVPLLRGEKTHYNRKVDIYSFAIVLWELLTNCTPFKGMTSLQAAYAAAKNQRPCVDNLPTDLVPLLKSSWSEDPATRPEFTEILGTLSDFQDQLLCQTHTQHAMLNVTEQQICDLVTDSPGTRHLMDKSGEVEGRKSRSSSPKFLRCFDKCFST